MIASSVLLDSSLCWKLSPCLGHVWGFIGQDFGLISQTIHLLAKTRIPFWNAVGVCHEIHLKVTCVILRARSIYDVKIQCIF